MAKGVRDIIIIGGGIAAHTAALYNSRANFKPIVISGPEPDQLSLTTLVENYPGFTQGILGPDLIKNCKEQAKRFGTEYIEGWVESFKKAGKYYEISVGNKKYYAKAVIISTGASARWLDVKGEDKYKGRGVSTCATCDAALFRNKRVVVIGGGDTAMEETLSLYKFASKITIIHRKNKFRASKIMQDRVLKLKDKVGVVWNSVVSEILGDGKFVTGVKIKNVKTNDIKEIKCEGVFLAIGHTPNVKAFQKLVKLDKLGYIKTDERCRTNLHGVFAAGDVQDPVYRQAITSAGSGCIAAMEAERYVEDLKSTGK